jgi:hypothetical protein
MVEEFLTQERDQEFKNWLLQHPHGFYLNKRTNDEVMLHKVGCFHLGFSEGCSSTTKFKVGSDDREELETWAITKKFNLVSCRHCNP